MSLKQRATTGVVFGAVMIGGMLYSPLSCASLLLLVAVLALWEFYGLLLEQGDRKRQVLHTLAGGIIPVLVYLKYLLNIDITLFLILLPVAWFSLFLMELFDTDKRPFDKLGFAFGGTVYVGLPFSLGIWMSSTQSNFGEAGHLFLLASIFMVWASDVFAYLLGSKIGKHKMFPRISPKKTWEGTLSGVVGALITGLICSSAFPALEQPLYFWLIVATICTTFGILGDLVESMLKRSLGIKDSGTILPGHGGILDRFDAYLFVLPFIYTFVQLYFYMK
jgi:phosphatidate cytidylyltransferase